MTQLAPKGTPPWGCIQGGMLGELGTQVQWRGPGMPQECFEMVQIRNLANLLWPRDATVMLLGGQKMQPSKPSRREARF